AGDSEVEQFFLPYRTFRCEVAAERAWHSEAGRRQQHHRAVYACGSRIVFLVPVADPPEEKCKAQRQMKVFEDAADDRSANHVRITGLESNQRDDQLRRIAEGGVEQTAHGVAGPRSDLFGGPHNQYRDRHDGQGGGKEDHRGRHLAGVFENHGHRNENEKPVDGGLHGTDSLIVVRMNAFSFRPGSAGLQDIELVISEIASSSGADNERVTSDGLPQGDVNVVLPRLKFLIDSDHGLVLLDRVHWKRMTN